MNNSYFPVGQVCNLSGQDAVLSYDYFCDAIIRHAEVNRIGISLNPVVSVLAHARGANLVRARSTRLNDRMIRVCRELPVVRGEDLGLTPTYCTLPGHIFGD
jgi:hypothetical protein